jgi:electron transfer flavoprotein alpha subunit
MTMVLSLVEHDRGKINIASLEMLTLGRGLSSNLNGPLEAVLIGQESTSLAEGLGRYGVSRVHLIQHEHLTDYAPEAWAQSVVQLIDSEHPHAVIAAGTDRGNEILAHIAAQTNLPMAANCTIVQPGDPYQVTRVRWGGSLLEEATLHGTPKLMTIALHAVPAIEVDSEEMITVEEFTPQLDEKVFRVRISERVEAADDKISLTDARVVVGGGRGVGSAEGFQILDNLAEILGGAVGGSRVATNLGWRPHADQIGQTGARIAPDLYIACGISGAIQHMVGCKGSKHILAINQDADSPIVTKADYAVIGDLHEIVPALCEELKKAKSG